jgi:uncharacterized membrane protein YeaQ/YmgE (transglycosylase-associated protein family)
MVYINCGAIVAWAVFGLIVGAIARLLWPGRQPAGCLGTIVLGLVGSIVGGFVTNLFVGGPDNPWHPAGWIMSIVGAILVLWIAALFTSDRGES